MEEQIKQMYDELYKSKYAALEKAKNESLSAIDKTEAENKDTYYNQRNQAALDSAKRLQQGRDYMARNNLIQSGENMDMMIRNNTDYTNDMGSIRSDENKFKSSIASDRLKINNNFGSDVASMRGDVEAQKMKELMAYQKEQEALARSYASGGSGGYSSGGSGGSDYSSTEYKNALYKQVNDDVQSGNTIDLAETKNTVQGAFDGGYISKTDYEKYMKDIAMSQKYNPGDAKFTRVEPKQTTTTKKKKFLGIF